MDPSSSFVVVKVGICCFLIGQGLASLFQNEKVELAKIVPHVYSVFSFFLMNRVHSVLCMSAYVLVVINILDDALERW